jgi:hypothetical protein
MRNIRAQEANASRRNSAPTTMMAANSAFLFFDELGTGSA